MKSYFEMLDEAYNELGKISKSEQTDRISIPTPEVSYYKKWTVIRNAKNICDILNRDIELLSRFLQKEFNVQSKVENDEIILLKNLQFDQIKNKIDKFIEIFVRCPVCKKLDTKLIKKGRIYYIKCLVCGAESPVLYEIKK